jgi:hypothetical protein
VKGVTPEEEAIPPAEVPVLVGDEVRRKREPKLRDAPIAPGAPLDIETDESSFEDPVERTSDFEADRTASAEGEAGAGFAEDSFA